MRASLDPGRVELAQLVGENGCRPAVVDQVVLDLDQCPAALVAPDQGPSRQRRLAGVDPDPDQPPNQSGPGGHRLGAEVDRLERHPDAVVDDLDRLAPALLE